MTHKLRQTANWHFCLVLILSHSKILNSFSLALLSSKEKTNSNTTRSFAGVDNLEYDCSSGATVYGHMPSLDQSDLGRRAVANGMCLTSGISGKCQTTQSHWDKCTDDRFWVENKQNLSQYDSDLCVILVWTYDYDDIHKSDMEW